MPHQSLASAFVEAKLLRGGGKRVRMKRTLKETVWSAAEAKAADRAIADPWSPDTTLNELKELSLELMWEHNRPG